MSTMVVDSHQHFWRYDPVAHDWIDPDTMGAIARDFLPDDLLIETRSAGVDAVVSVQATQTIDETKWLLDLAQQTQEIAGVVGWAPLAAPDIERRLDAIAHPLLRGLRHIVQNEPDDGFLLREDFNRGVAALGQRDLAYDILVFERQLPAAIEFVDRHPGQRFVLDHIAKPRIAQHAMEPWRSNMRELARRPNVACKISGLVTEADWSGWNSSEMTPYLDIVIEAFGAGRLMFGSDWPVCLVAAGYADWKRVVDDWSAPLSEPERDLLFGGAAVEAYGLKGSEACK